MEGRVGLVFKLPRKEPAVLVGELSSLSQIKKVYIYNLTCFWKWRWWLGCGELTFKVFTSMEWQKTIVSRTFVSGVHALLEASNSVAWCGSVQDFDACSSDDDAYNAPSSPCLCPCLQQG